MKVGDKKKFNHPQKGVWGCKEIIEEPNIDFDWDWDRGECPHCSKRIVITKTYKLEKLFIWEKDGETFTTSQTEPVTNDGKGLHLRLPDKNFFADKDMTDVVKEKSKYLKLKEK